MKSKSLLVLACLFSLPVMAQTLPDEINYGPYETRYRTLERDTATAQVQLYQSRVSLAEAKRFIREMTAHISELESQIGVSENEIARLRREIPELERQISILRNEDSRVMSDLRSKQPEKNSLVSRYQQAQRDLRPLENLLARKEQGLREMQADLNQFERIERDAVQRLSRAEAQAQNIDRQHGELKNQIRQMQAELQSIGSRISASQGQISNAEGSIGTLNSNLSTERVKLGSLNGRVSEYESELGRLRSSGGASEEIASIERKLGAARNTRDNTASEIRNLETQIGRHENQVRTLRSQIDELRRNQAALPSRISQAESRIRQFESERSQVQAEINRYGAEVQIARRNVNIGQQQVSQFRNEIRVDEQNVLRQRQFVENVGRQIESVRIEIANLTQRSRNLNIEIARASEATRANEAEIPKIQQSIRKDKAEIAEGQRDLGTARIDERNFTAAVARDESKLSDLTSRRDSAQGEMSVRLNLFNRYLGEAQLLGSDQASTATTLGEKEGQRLSEVLSKQNGNSVGRELGVAEAKHWGSVRGEIQGYDLGYSEGLRSSEDIGRATSEASIKASLDAELFAQTNLKPVFFEDFVLEEFKKPLVGKLNLSLLKSLKGLNVPLAEEALETLSPLSPSELARSEQLKTPLDSLIAQIAKDVKAIEAKARRLSDPAVAFEAPVKIPLGTPACIQVYKNLPVFKAACEGSYKGAFSNNYVNAARESFESLYQRQFTSEFNIANVTQREVSFPADMASAQKVGTAEGLRIGKIEIYQKTYASVYSTAYASELEKARTKAKGDASAELMAFLKVNPLLTLSKTELAAENFRGGEDVSIMAKVKNIGSVALTGPVLLRITEVVNAEKITGDAVLNSAGALSVTDLPSLKVKVLGSAKAGDKMIVRGVVDLPGDLYRPIRQEKFELIQILSANPSHELSLNYNKTPDIKGVFRRNIHFLTVSISPKVEEIKEGYKISLSTVGEASAVVDIQTGTVETGALSQGASKAVRLSYVFKDAAKGKAIAMELSISYAGKVIKKELITLVPR